MRWGLGRQPQRLPQPRALFWAGLAHVTGLSEPMVRDIRLTFDGARPANIRAIEQEVLSDMIREGAR